MESEHLSRPRPRVTPVREPRDDAGALVNERQPFLVLDPLESRAGVAFSLFLSCRDLVAPVFGLRLNNADGAAINEQDVVSGTDVRRVFPHGNPLAGVEVKRILALDMPTNFGQPSVDLVAGDLLWVLVLRCRRHCPLNPFCSQSLTDDLMS